MVVVVVVEGGGSGGGGGGGGSRLWCLSPGQPRVALISSAFGDQWPVLTFPTT